MKHLAYKDKKLRKNYAKIENSRAIIKMLLNNHFISDKTKIVLTYKLNQLVKQSSITKIRNRCVYTSRGRSVNRKFHLSRSQTRDFFLMGIVPGFKKAVW
jgi:ribosomal protein S14